MLHRQQPSCLFSLAAKIDRSDIAFIYCTDEPLQAKSRHKPEDKKSKTSCNMCLIKFLHAFSVLLLCHSTSCSMNVTNSACFECPSTSFLVSCRFSRRALYSCGLALKMNRTNQFGVRGNLQFWQQWQYKICFYTSVTGFKQP